MPSKKKPPVTPLDLVRVEAATDLRKLLHFDPSQPLTRTEMAMRARTFASGLLSICHSRKLPYAVQVVADGKCCCHGPDRKKPYQCCGNPGWTIHTDDGRAFSSSFQLAVSMGISAHELAHVYSRTPEHWDKYRPTVEAWCKDPVYRVKKRRGHPPIKQYHTTQGPLPYDADLSQMIYNVIVDCWDEKTLLQAVPALTPLFRLLTAEAFHALTPSQPLSNPTDPQPTPTPEELLTIILADRKADTYNITEPPFVRNSRQDKYVRPEVMEFLTSASSWIHIFYEGSLSDGSRWGRLIRCHRLLYIHLMELIQSGQTTQPNSGPSIDPSGLTILVVSGPPDPNAPLGQSGSIPASPQSADGKTIVAQIKTGPSSLSGSTPNDKDGTNRGTPDGEDPAPRPGHNNPPQSAGARHKFERLLTTKDHENCQAPTQHSRGSYGQGNLLVGALIPPHVRYKNLLMPGARLLLTSPSPNAPHASSSGRFLGDITRLYSDLRVFHRKLPSTDYRTACALCIDLSGSMDNADLPFLLSAARGFAEACTTLNVNTCGIGFNDGALRVPPKEITRLRADSFGGTGTNLAVSLARKWLIAQPEPRKVILIFTDGSPNDPKKLQRELSLCSGLNIKTVGVGVNGNHIDSMKKSMPGVPSFEITPQNIVSGFQKAILELRKASRAPLTHLTKGD